MKKFGHELKPLNAKITFIGTAYGEREEIIKTLLKKMDKS